MIDQFMSLFSDCKNCNFRSDKKETDIPVEDSIHLNKSFDVETVIAKTQYEEHKNKLNKKFDKNSIDNTVLVNIENDFSSRMNTFLYTKNEPSLNNSGFIIPNEKIFNDKANYVVSSKQDNINNCNNNIKSPSLIIIDDIETPHFHYAIAKDEKSCCLIIGNNCIYKYSFKNKDKNLIDQYILDLKNKSNENMSDVNLFKTNNNTYRFGIFITNFNNLINLKLNVLSEDSDKSSKFSHESKRFTKLLQPSNKWHKNKSNNIPKNISIPADYPLNIFVNRICNESIFEIYLNEESKYICQFRPIICFSYDK